MSTSIEGTSIASKSFNSTTIDLIQAIQVVMLYSCQYLACI